MMPNPKERALRAVVEEYGIHETLKGLIEICYRKEQEIGQSNPPVGANWRDVANALHHAEVLSTHRRF